MHTWHEVYTRYVVQSREGISTLLIVSMQQQTAAVGRVAAIINTIIILPKVPMSTHKYELQWGN